MFNIVLSITILFVPIALYGLVIRPRLRARFTDLYAGIDSFWERQWARLYAFRSVVVGVLGILAAALPDILVKLAPVDFSQILPQPWGLWVGTAVGVILPIMKAFETKPREEH